MRALIIEDEQSLRETLRDELTKAGFTVDVAADGEEGLFAGLEYPIDVAVVDLGLPKLSGIVLSSTEVTEGLKDGDVVITGISTATLAGPAQPQSNPFAPSFGRGGQRGGQQQQRR